MAANKAWISGSVKMLLLKLLSEKDMYELCRQVFPNGSDYGCVQARTPILSYVFAAKNKMVGVTGGFLKKAKEIVEEFS